MAPSPENVTQLLVRWGNGDQAAFDQLMPIACVTCRSITPDPARRPDAAMGRISSLSTTPSTLLTLNPRQSETVETRFFGGLAGLGTQCAGIFKRFAP